MAGILYMSSTPFDLAAHRQVLAAQMADPANGFAAVELKMPSADDSVKQRKALVNGASVVVIVLGMVFGNIDAQSGLSLVQLDYDEAVSHQIPVLVYLIDEDEHLVLPKHVDTGRSAQQLSEFKAVMCRQHAVRFFENAEDLAAKILNDLHRIEDLKQAAQIVAAEVPEKSVGQAPAGAAAPVVDNKPNARRSVKRYELTPQRFAFFKQHVEPVLTHQVDDAVLQEALEYILVGNTMSAASMMVRSASIPIDEAIEEVRQIERVIVATVQKHRAQNDTSGKA